MGPTEQINMELCCWVHWCWCCSTDGNTVIRDSLGEKSSSALCMPETNGTQFLNFPHESLEMKIGKPPGVIRNEWNRWIP